MTENLPATLEELVDQLTPKEIRTLALAALEAHGWDLVWWDEAIDARMAMTDALDEALPERVRAAEAKATSNPPEAEVWVERDDGLIELWRPIVEPRNTEEEDPA